MFKNLERGNMKVRTIAFIGKPTAARNQNEDFLHFVVISFLLCDLTMKVALAWIIVCLN